MKTYSKSLAAFLIVCAPMAASQSAAQTSTSQTYSEPSSLGYGYETPFGPSHEGSQSRYADIILTNAQPDSDILNEASLYSVPLDDEYSGEVLTGIPRRREGLFQGAEVTGSYLPGNGDDDLGVNEMMAWFSVGVPFPTINSPLILSPTYGLTLLDGPNTAPLPAQLHRASVDLLWMPRIGDWTFHIAATPGVWSDFEDGAEDGFRVPARLLAQRSFFDGTLDIVGGVVYLDRDDISFLPAIGLTWRPTPDWNFAVVIPRPKVAYRFRWDGVREDWIYIGGEFGGNTWAVQTPGVGNDKLTLADLRLQLGWERRVMGGFGVGLEVAYVFDRSYELESGANADLEDSFMVRGMLRF